MCVILINKKTEMAMPLLETNEFMKFCAFHILSCLVSCTSKLSAYSWFIVWRGLTVQFQEL